jgi:hypothetical protein
MVKLPISYYFNLFTIDLELVTRSLTRIYACRHKCTVFPHTNIHKYHTTSHGAKKNNQIDHGFTDTGQLQLYQHMI